MFKAVVVSAFFATQVNEEVCGLLSVFWGHVPHDAKGVAGHLTDLNIARSGKRGVHVCHLPLEQYRKVHYYTILECSISVKCGYI